MLEQKVNTSGRQRFVLALFGTLFVASAVVSYFSIRDSWTAPERIDGAGAADSVSMPEEAALPPGPHLAEFQSSCLICHSARLPLGQPALKEEKWAEIVHKMVAAYGAPLGKAEEAQVVKYLVAMQAQR
jgi:mono/diheme cytochrome c family protein